MKYLPLILLLLSCTAPQVENSSNSKLETKISSKWTCPTSFNPNHAVQVSESEWWLTGSKDYYLSINKSTSKPTENKVGNFDDIVQIVKKGETYLILTYNSSTRMNEAWMSKDMNSMELLNIEDAAAVYYSEKQNKLYWIHASRNLFSYDFESNESTPFFKDYRSSAAAMDVEGNYLGIEDTEGNIYVINLENQEILEQLDSKAGVMRKLLGVSKDGAAMFVKLQVAEKNASGESSKNEFVLFKNGESNVFLRADAGWAFLYEDNLMILDKETSNEFVLFDMNEIIK
jgi:hypothetical protein